MICITAVCIFMHSSVVHVLPEIPFMARAETKVVSLSQRQWPRQKHIAILSKFETAAAFSIVLASKSSLAHSVFRFAEIAALDCFRLKKWLWTKTETLRYCCTPSLLVGKIILHCYADEPNTSFYTIKADQNKKRKQS